MTRISREEPASSIANNFGDRALKKENLIYDSDDTQIYVIPGLIDMEQAALISGNITRFVQNHDWRITRKLESIKKDLAPLLAEIFDRLQALEEKLDSLEQAISRLGENETG